MNDTLSIEAGAAAEAVNPVIEAIEEKLGDPIRADPRPIMNYTLVALVGMLGGFIVGYVVALGH